MANPQEALQRAVAAYGRGDFGAAERACLQVLAAKADSFEALYLLGIVAGRTGRAAEAAELIGRAVTIDPRNADAHYNLAVALGELGRNDAALAAYDRVIALAPRNADAHYNRGVALQALGRAAEALAAHERAIAIAPRHVEAHHNRGVALARLGRHAEAIAAFEGALALRPDYAAAHNHRGAALAESGRHQEALAAYERAIALAPGYAEAHNHRAIALLDLDRAAPALESAERALALKPGLADAWYIRGNALRELHRHGEARESYERAIALAPGHTGAHWNLADCHLILGDFARGWDEYEWRWKLPARSRALRDLGRPLWLGAEPLEGRAILLHAELGLGDTLQFCRYVPMVAARGGRVILEVPQPLVELMRTLDGVDAIFARGAALPAFDCHCPLMSLPLAFRTEVATVPAGIPYLKSDPARVARWSGELGARGRPRIGFAWSGSQGLAHDKRSMGLARMLPLLDARFEWVSLQKEVPAADAALLASRADIRALGPMLGDFADTAAVVEQLDLLVTVDTSVAHVAGALGRPLWILLPHNPHDWRWLLDREDSLWYPHARLFRQPRPDDWESVVARAADALARDFVHG